MRDGVKLDGRLFAPSGDQIDLGYIGFGPNTTVAYAPNNSNTGGTLTVDDQNGMLLAYSSASSPLLLSPACSKRAAFGPHARPDPPPVFRRLSRVDDQARSPQAH
jgi:hypothetical protein